MRGGVRRAFAAAGAVLVGAWLATLFWAPLPVDGPASATDHALAALGASCVVGALALAWAFAAGRPARRVLALGRSALPWGESALAVLGTLGLSHLLDLAVRATGLAEQSVLGALADALAGARGAALALALVGLALAPGVAEELLFRGALQGSLLRSRAVSTPLALAASAAVFGAFHLDLVQGVAAALLGLHLGALAAAARSVRPAVAAHVCNNLAGVANLAFGPDGPGAGVQAALALAAWLASLAVLARRLPGAGEAWRARA